ncbi:MAG TPA: hypothetical protein HA362_02790 [Nanoarchaeota archaeon]|nr:hypothetical protein [Nanoarchaeota archaeon]
MLDTAIIKKINEFVYLQPRSVQEVALLLKVNWRTADRYVDRISEEQGTISTKTFRGGTKGALKIVFWCNIEKIHSTTFQERLYKKIEAGRKKEDFSPMDIFQYVDEKKRHAAARLDNAKDRAFITLLSKCQKEVLCFSGNMSWINKSGAIETVRELVKNNVQIKILTRIDVASIKNINRLLEIGEKQGRKCFDIRHCDQPLRAFIIDGKAARLTEKKDPAIYKPGELKKEVMIDYEIRDEEWVQWLEKVFYSLFRTSVDSEKRMKDMKAVENFEP